MFHKRHEHLELHVYEYSCTYFVGMQTSFGYPDIKGAGVEAEGWT
jgi:hypothetical protein